MRDRYTFVTPAGVEHTLPVIDPKRGLGLPPAQIATEATIGDDGSRVLNVRHGERPVDLAIAFRPSLHGDADAIVDVIRDLAEALNPKAGAGQLRRYRADGTVRELVARLSQGLELVEEDPAWVTDVLTFLAADPYWRDTADTTATYTLGAGSTFLPGPPFEIASATIFAEPTIDNVGNVDAWPVWTITGPANGVELANATTGRTLELTTVLAGETSPGAGDAETLIIDTRPGAKSIVDGAGVNLFPDLVAGSRLWALVPGDNVVTITMDGADEQTSEVELAYRPRYLTS